MAELWALIGKVREAPCFTKKIRITETVMVAMAKWLQGDYALMISV